MELKISPQGRKSYYTNQTCPQCFAHIPSSKLAIPQATLDTFETKMREFMWQQNLKKGIHLISWNHICSNVQFSGLSIRRRLPFQHCHCVKNSHWTFFLNKKGGPWFNIIEAKYLRKHNPLLLQQNGTNIWKLCGSAELFLRRTSWSIENWKDIMFWKDPWMIPIPVELVPLCID